MTAPAASRPTARQSGSRPSAGLTPARVAALALLAGLAVVGLRLAAHDGNSTAFARFGADIVDVDAAPDGAFLNEGAGYDGQFFYRIARAPTSRADQVDGIELDRPAFRTRRIVYPATAWVLSLGGQQPLVPWALIATNLAALTVLAGAVATIARDEGAPTWLGLVAAGWPGFLVALTGDLAELTAAAILACALLALRRKRWLGAAALLALAMLARESTAVIALGVLGAAWARHLPFSRRLGLASADDGPPGWVGALPLVALLAWLGLVDSWWSGRQGDTQLAQTADQFGLPLTGPIRQIGTFAANLADSVSTYQFLQFLIVLLVVGTAGAALRHRDAGRPHERMALLAALGATSMLVTWDRAVVFLRYPNEIVVLAVVLAATNAPALLRTLRSAVPVLLLTALPIWITID